MARLLVHQNDCLPKQLTELLPEIIRLRGVDGPAQLALEIEKVEKQMAVPQRRLFTDSSEKRPVETAPDPDAPARVPSARGA